jgi:N-acetylglucosamine-6-phosphate deacetylase
MSDYCIISGPQIYTEQGILQNTNVVIRADQIHAIDNKKYSSSEVWTFPNNYHLVPGFIDLHVHGAQNSDVMDATVDALTTISQVLAKEGTTGFLATTMTAPPEKIEQALIVVQDTMQIQQLQGASILGAHLEGPFISANKAGAQSKEMILPLDIKYLKRWQKITNNTIKLVTLAPELPGGIEFIHYLKQQNIIASIGHSDATYQEALAGIEAGCSYTTHIFNAMRGIHQREPGAVTAALLSDKISTELIVDGIHLHPAIVELILKLKGKEKMILVTDAMRAKCLCDGSYDLGGQSVSVKEGIARLPNGMLAGSVLRMSEALQNVLKFTGCTLLDAIKMAAENPAKMLGLFSKKGSIAVGKDADLVVLDAEYEVAATICGGRVVYQCKA